MIARLLSRFSGTSEETIRAAFDQLAAEVGEGSKALLACVVMQLIVLGFFFTVVGLSQ